MKTLYESDFVIVKDNKPIENYNIVYHYTAVIELFNTGFKLNEGEEFIPMVELPSSIQEKYLNNN